MSSSGKRTPRVFMYRSNTNGDWRWKVVAANGKIIGASTEGYRRRKDMIKNLTTITGGVLDPQDGDSMTVFRSGIGAEHWTVQDSDRRQKEESP